MIKELNNCIICPRKCGINRNITCGYCRVKNQIKLAKACLHFWEEPCISGSRGSGTVFFSNCNMRCVFCQNYDISHEGFGKEVSIEKLAEIMLYLEEKGAHNINLVSPTPYIFHIREAVKTARNKGLTLPILYNTNGYENAEILKSLEGIIDIYLPDLKYYDDKYSIRYSKTPAYFEHATAAILEMYRQVGNPVFNDDGILIKGLMIRHMMLPGLLFDSKKVVDWVLDNLPPQVFLNIMCQYTPMYKAKYFDEINRKLNPKHYESLIDYALSKGLENGFTQDHGSATEEYTPIFDLSGIE
ncbi:putative pyruvate formate lyase activating enzyme [Lutispora thermophila DSM 19022]|uniref:Putative pyruvate formate lyase activating enzyme n=1 Tax=Lutispora thermophila DSM 19022 TaxID=1122184 RepID=A0A1M6FKC2_9FIRM|nr:putative pyruvate formate lyase activating enzyme [Lutispora thermophila DSM 19022]